MLRRRDAGGALVSLAGGALIALLGWVGVRRLTATSLDRLVLEADRPVAEWTVAVIFRVKECPTRMALIEQLNGLAGARVRVRGLLVVDQDEFSNWKDLVRAYGIAFPVRPVSPAKAASALGTVGTPTLLVYDPAGRLRLLTDIAEQDLAGHILAQIMSLSIRSPKGS